MEAPPSTENTRHARSRPAPASRRHERGRRPRCRAHPRDRALGRGARGLVRPSRSASLAVAARPQRVSGGLDRTPRLTLMSTPARRLARHARPRGPPGRRRVQRAVRGGRTSRRTTIAPSCRSPTPRRGSPRSSNCASDRRGCFHQRMTLRNTADTPYTVQSMLLAFPVPWDATELLDTTGRHLRERTPQRRAFTYGTHLRESRRGRPGADSTLLLAAGRPGFGFETGRVHGIHVAWSGNHRVLAERVTTGEAFLAGGELLGPGEVDPRAGRVDADTLGDRLVGRRAHRAVAPLPRRMAAAAAASAASAARHAEHVGGGVLRPHPRAS